MFAFTNYVYRFAKLLHFHLFSVFWAVTSVKVRPIFQPLTILFCSFVHWSLNSFLHFSISFFLADRGCRGVRVRMASFLRGGEKNIWQMRAWHRKQALQGASFSLNPGVHFHLSFPQPQLLLGFSSTPAATTAWFSSEVICSPQKSSTW